MSRVALKDRAIVAALAIILLVALGFYSTTHSLHHDLPPHVNLNALTLSPAKYQGEEVWFQGFVRDKPERDRVVFATSYGSISAQIPEGPEVSAGALVAVKGRVKDNQVLATSIHVIDYREMRYALSFLGSLVALYLFIREYRLTKEGIDYA